MNSVLVPLLICLGIVILAFLVRHIYYKIKIRRKIQYHKRELGLLPGDYILVNDKKVYQVVGYEFNKGDINVIVKSLRLNYSPDALELVQRDLSSFDAEILEAQVWAWRVIYKLEAINFLRRNKTNW